MSVDQKARQRRRAAPRPAGDTDSETRKRRNRILSVAIREFASKGFAGARVDEIAKRARVSKQLLYYYFGDKKELYAAAVAVAGRDYRALFDADSSPLLSYAERYVAAARSQNHKDIILFERMLLWDALQRGGAATARDHPVKANWARGRDIVRAAQEAGDLSPRLDTELLTLVLAAALHVPHASPHGVQALTGHQPYDDEFQERHAKFIADLIVLLAPRNEDTTAHEPEDQRRPLPGSTGRR